MARLSEHDNVRALYTKQDVAGYCTVIGQLSGLRNAAYRLYVWWHISVIINLSDIYVDLQDLYVDLFIAFVWWHIYGNV